LEKNSTNIKWKNSRISEDW